MNFDSNSDVSQIVDAINARGMVTYRGYQVWGSVARGTNGFGDFRVYQDSGHLLIITGHIAGALEAVDTTFQSRGDESELTVGDVGYW